MAIRKFRKVGGFGDATDYLEVSDDGSITVSRSGRKAAAPSYLLEVCLAHVAGGDWYEMDTQMSLQDYVEKYEKEGHQHHVMSLAMNPGQPNHIYIHPDGIDGDTLDFIVVGNSLHLLPSHVRRETIEARAGEAIDCLRICNTDRERDITNGIINRIHALADKQRNKRAIVQPR